jgi:hypothetical protein
MMADQWRGGDQVFPMRDYELIADSGQARSAKFAAVFPRV